MSSLCTETVSNIGDSLISGCLKCSKECHNVYTLFTKHPTNENMSYFTHLYSSLCISYKFGLGSFYMAVHAVFPFLFENNGAKVTSELYNKMYSKKC